MSIVQRVQDALDRAAIPEAQAHNDGYRVEADSRGSVIVRWGHGEPLRGQSMIRQGHGLRSCASALASAGISIDPKTYEDSNGFYIQVIEAESV